MTRILEMRNSHASWINYSDYSQFMSIRYRMRLISSYIDWRTYSNADPYYSIVVYYARTNTMSMSGSIGLDYIR
jgi:hypothetical protein